MKEVYRLINLFVIITFSVNGMVFSGGILSRLDILYGGILFQKSILFNHHKVNYERNLLEGIIPTDAFEPVPDNFLFQWNNVLFDAEKKLAKLLLEESEKVIEKTEIDISNEVKENYAGSTSQRINKINGKHKHFKQKLEKKRNKNGKNLSQDRSQKSKYINR